MTELKPCLHCGCDTPWLSSAKHTQGLRWYVFCHVCGAMGGWKPTEAEAIDAWNTRAERTCHWEIEHSGTLYDKWRCSKCGYLHVESRTDGGATDLDPNYCPQCGAKVVDE